MRRIYGRGPAHLVGHLLVIAISAYVLSILFQARFAPQPLNLVLWLLGGAILHDAVFLPIFGVANTVLSRVLGATDGTSLRDLATGPDPAAADGGSEAAGRTAPAATGVASTSAVDREAIPVAAPTSPDGRRAVPIINHVRTPIVVSAVLFLVFLPRILDRQPQNFVNALGHAPPDFLGRWLAVSAALVVTSAVLYGVRRLRA